MDPRCLLTVPATASQSVQDMARMVVDLRLKTVTKANYGMVGRAATDPELNAALLWDDSVNAEIVERKARAPELRPAPPHALIVAVGAIVGDGLVADAITMLANALDRKDDVDAAARLLLHHLGAAKHDLRRQSDAYLQTDFESDIPF
jgi:hypothetical protein